MSTPSVRHHGHRHGMNARWLVTGAEAFHLTLAEISQETLRHLTPARIGLTEKENSHILS
jgi:hypothetical protein